MGRVKAAARNIIFGYIGNLTTQLLGFALRTIFISHLGTDLKWSQCVVYRHPVGSVHGGTWNRNGTQLQPV